MKSKQKRFGHAKLLCLVLSLLMMVSVMPMGATFASATDGEEVSSEVTLTEESVEPSESTESEESEPDEETEDTTYANSISGVLWIDANEDGIYDSTESPLADYPAYLYLEDDQDNVVQTATTDADGKYLFEDITLGRYVVGIKAEENGTEYLLPLCGVQQDNKFYFAPDWSKVISNPIDIDADMVVTGIDAAMRTMPQIQPMANATYTIDITNSTTVTNSISTQSIPGVSIISNVLTFDNTVDFTDTYILTGTTTTVRIVVAAGTTAKITLDGVNISNAVSSFQLQSSAVVNLTLADGTMNTLTCTTTSSATTGIFAGLHAPSGTTLTIGGTGSLTSTGGHYSAGIGGSYISSATSSNSSNGTGNIFINSGTVTAQSGNGGAGIGGGWYSANGGIAVTITGGTVNATSVGLGAGIGNGYDMNTGIIKGSITIEGGTVDAVGGNGGAGIGGGRYNTVSTITIKGGTVTATSGSEGAGIGGGSNGYYGTITISGGTVTAKSTVTSGSNYGAGIGAGYVREHTGIITVTGGRITATGGGTARDIGYGAGTSQTSTGAIIFTSGSIYPTRGGSYVSPAPTNGSANGNVLVYMTTVTVKDASDTVNVPNALVSIEGCLNSGYTYNAYTHDSGIAYVWVPAKTAAPGYTFEAEHDDYGYGSEDKTVAANHNNTVTVLLGMRTTLSRAPNTVTFITSTDPTPATLNVKAENADVRNLKDIISAEWFRVSTTDTTKYISSTFSAGYSAVAAADKGSNSTNLAESTGGDSSLRNYTMPVSENGKYWVMVHYKDGLGVDRYQVKSIVIDNVYTPSTGNYKGVNLGDSSTLYDEAIPSLTNASGDPLVGVAFELNSATTILTSTSDGTTAVAGTGATLTINAKNLAPLWITSAPTSQTVSVTGTNLGTTTFNYTLNPLAITVQFDSQGGTPSTIANQYYMSTDTFGTLPSVARTGYNLDGWFTAATGGTQVNATDTAGSHFTSGSTVTLYAQWTASAKTVTISNEVTGTHANMTKAFTFTVYFEDSASAPLASGTQFTYTGGIIAGSGATAPSGGTLTLDSAGKTTVPLTLTTGQTITIAGVATSGKVRVVQTTDANYTTSFKDSLDASSTSGADTGMRNMTAADRTFDFTNTRSVVPGGISTGSGGIVLLSLMALLALAAGLGITAAYRRRAGVR